MAINLERGESQPIKAQQFSVGLGWDSSTETTGKGFDLDVSVFILGANGKLFTNRHLVFYNNLSSPCGTVVHMEDNLSGNGDGDDEKVFIDLSKIEDNATEICFVVTIHKAEARRQHFGQVRNSFIRITDSATSIELVKYELDEDFYIETAVEFGRLYKNIDSEWEFEAVGSGLRGGLQDFLNKYN